MPVVESELCCVGGLEVMERAKFLANFQAEKHC